MGGDGAAEVAEATSAAMPLELGDVRRLRALLALRQVERHPLAFVQSAITLTRDGRVVDEHIITVIAADEAIAFVRVEPFHGAFHELPSFLAGLVT